MFLLLRTLLIWDELLFRFESLGAMNMMTEISISANALARNLDVPSNRITEILNGKRSTIADGTAQSTETEKNCNLNGFMI